MLEATHKYITMYKNLLMVCKNTQINLSINYITLKLACCYLSDFWKDAIKFIYLNAILEKKESKWSQLYFCVAL